MMIEHDLELARREKYAQTFPALSLSVRDEPQMIRQDYHR